MLEKRVLKEIYSNFEAIKNLELLCDDFGGRFSGTEENKAAADFMLRKFEEYGFETPHLESFTFKGCTVGKSSLEITDPVKRNIPCLTLPMTTSGEAEAELVWIDSRTGDNTLSIEETSYKIVMGKLRTPSLSESGSALGFIWMHPYSAMGPPTGCINSSFPAVSIDYARAQVLLQTI